MTRYAAKTDRNHSEVRAALRAAGWTVIDTARAGNGFPDLIAMKAGVFRLVEVKDGNEPLTAREAAFFDAVYRAGCADTMVVVRHVDHAVARVEGRRDA